MKDQNNQIKEIEFNSQENQKNLLNNHSQEIDILSQAMFKVYFIVRKGWKRHFEEETPRSLNFQE